MGSVLIQTGGGGVNKLVSMLTNKSFSITAKDLEGCTAIGDKVFYHNTYLTGITMPDSILSIGEEAFYACSALTSVSIPASVTSLSDGLFEGCSNLIITIPDNIESIGNYTFKGCTSSTSVSLPTGLETIGKGAFQNCTGLTTITIPSTLTTIGEDAFDGCTNLVSIYYGGTIDDWCQIQGLQYLLNQGKSKKLYINGVLISQLVIAEGTTEILPYSFCNLKLESVSLPNSLTTIGERAFMSCMGIVSITIPANVSLIDTEAFYLCTKLVEVCNKSSLNIVKGSADNGYVAYYAYDVYTTEQPSKVYVDENGFQIYNDSTKILLGYAGDETSITLPTDVPIIADYAFYNNKDLSITMATDTTSIGDYAFYNSGVSNYIPVTVTHIGTDAFGPDAISGTIEYGKRYSYVGGTADDWCSIEGIENFTKYLSTGVNYFFIGGGGSVETQLTLSVSTIPIKAFAGMASLQYVTIGNTVQSVGSQAFASSSSNLRGIYLPDVPIQIGSSAFVMDSDTNGFIHGDGSNVAKVAGDNYSGRGTLNLTITSGVLTSLHLNSRVSRAEFNSGVTEIGSEAFMSCTSLRYVYLPSTIEVIGYDAFYNCSSLYYNTNQNAKYLGSHGNSYIALINPSSTNLSTCTVNSNCKVIASKAFYRCTSLTTVTIPVSVTHLNPSAFFDCTSLTTINYDGTMSQWADIVKGSNWDYNTGNYTVHCSDGDIPKQV